MKKYPLNPIAVKELSSLSGALLFGCLLSLSASAQTPPSATSAAQTALSTTEAPPATAVPQTPATAPLNLNSDDVAKEISKENHAIDMKLDALSTTPDAFAQSILDSEHKNKISGMVEAGAGVGSMPVQRGSKSDSFTCEHTAAAINDQISTSTQVSVYAQVNSCNTR
jgi:hypothetical protein